VASRVLQDKQTCTDSHIGSQHLRLILPERFVLTLEVARREGARCGAQALKERRKVRARRWILSPRLYHALLEHALAQLVRNRRAITAINLSNDCHTG